MDHLPPEFLISRVAASCLFTMTAASVKDSRQTIPKGPHVPTEDIRMLRARLILEEALETIGDEHGKYLKPKGWKGPDHLRQFSIGCDLSEIGRDLVKLAEKTITQ